MTIPIDLKGKGWWVWYIPDIEGGDVSKIVVKCREADISHLIIKIANGVYGYGISDTGVDQAKALVDEIHARAPNMKALGWTYTYASNTDAEVAKAVERIDETGVDGFVVDAEAQYKVSGGAAIAEKFMSKLRAELPNMAIGLSSYRYPSLHPEFPWSTFRKWVNYDMPQVYWEQNHNVVYQLEKSYGEFLAMNPKLPYIPTGSAYKRGEWQATPADVLSFLQTAKNNLKLQAANFWEWGRMSLYVPDLWQPIADFDWPYYEPGEPMYKTFNAYATVEVGPNNVAYAKIDVPANIVWDLQAVGAYADRAARSFAIQIIDTSGRSLTILSKDNVAQYEYLSWTGNITLNHGESVALEGKSLQGMNGTTLHLLIRGEILEQA